MNAAVFISNYMNELNWQDDHKKFKTGTYKEF